MSTLTTSSTGQKVWLVHDGFGGHLFEFYTSKSDANYVRIWHAPSIGRREIMVQEIDLRLVIREGREF